MLYCRLYFLTADLGRDCAGWVPWTKNDKFGCFSKFIGWRNLKVQPSSILVVFGGHFVSGHQFKIGEKLLISRKEH